MASDLPAHRRERQWTNMNTSTYDPQIWLDLQNNDLGINLAFDREY